MTLDYTISLSLKYSYLNLVFSEWLPLSYLSNSCIWCNYCSLSSSQAFLSSPYSLWILSTCSLPNFFFTSICSFNPLISFSSFSDRFSLRWRSLLSLSTRILKSLLFLTNFSCSDSSLWHSYSSLTISSSLRRSRCSYSFKRSLFFLRKRSCPSSVALILASMLVRFA